MRRLGLYVAIAALLVACGEETPQEPLIQFPDPELAAISFLTAHVFDDPASLRSRFTREVEPNGFPIRAMVNSPEEYAFERIWRLRTIDNRYVVEAVIRLNGQFKRITLWLEVQEGNWRISGWAPALSEVDPEATTPSAGANVPAPFAAAAFRGAPSMDVVYIPSNRESKPRANLPVRARVQLQKVALGCPEKALESVMKNSNDRFAECYADAIDGGRMRPGRMTYGLQIEGRPATVTPTLSETTLINSRLTDCVERVLSNLWIDRSDTCEVTALIIFSPKRKR